MSQPESLEVGPDGYSAAEVEALTVKARALLDQLREVLAEIGERMTALTGEQSGEPGGWTTTQRRGRDASAPCA